MNPAPPARLTPETIAILSRHASERAELEANQHNDRVELVERQRAELAAAVGVEAPLVPLSRPAS